MVTNNENNICTNGGDGVNCDASLQPSLLLQVQYSR